MFLGLDGAGSGHHDDALAADGNTFDGDNGVLTLELARDELVGLHDAGDSLHAGEDGKDLRGNLAGVPAEERNDGLIRAQVELRLQPEGVGSLHDAADFLNRSALLHFYYHVRRL